MQGEAAPCQPIERAAAAPVERQKAARLAGRRTGDLVTLDHDRLGAALTEEIGDGGADGAAAADDDASGSAHPATVSVPQASA
jgi:hypothetical protein